jgi:hypothetical protein
MTNGSIAVWITLALIALIVMHFKGYITLPLPNWLRRREALTPNGVHASAKAKVPATATDLTSRELGVLMAVAARREAEIELAEQVAEDARKKLVAGFQAPFVGSFGVDPPKAADTVVPSGSA